MRCASWNNHSYSTAPDDPRLRALRMHTFDIQIEWNMNLVALEATDRKVITFTIDYKIQRYQCMARCRHKSIHVTNAQHQSARTRLYNDKGLQTRVRDSKICHVVSRGYMKRDHLNRLHHSTHEEKRRVRYLKQAHPMHVFRCNIQCVKCNVWHAMCCNMLCVTCYV